VSGSALPAVPAAAGLLPDDRGDRIADRRPGAEGDQQGDHEAEVRRDLAGMAIHAVVVGCVLLVEVAWVAAGAVVVFRLI